MDAKTTRSRLRRALRLPFRSRHSSRDTLYYPLNSENREIRVLRIDPSQPDDVDTYCSLEIVSLNSALAYQALSYEWGPPDIGKSASRVFLNSHEVPTTPNLRLALKHLQSGSLYWIDALCIDQSDDKERGHQVRLMTEIYRHALAVVVWLGLEEGNSGRGMDFLNEVGAFTSERCNSNDPDVEFHDWLYETLSDNAYDARWDGLRQIFQRSYWARLWIIQELVVTPRPNEVWLLCGSSKARFTSLRMVSRKIFDFALAIPHIRHSRQTLDTTIMSLKECGQRVRDVSVHVEAWGSPNAENVGIVRLLSRYWELLCADPRDKVYALLGVSHLYPDVELPISYTIPTLDVYKNLAKYVIEGSKSLNILQYSGHGQGETPVRPSWVPNWQYDPRLRMILVSRNASGKRSSFACFSSNESILTTQAFVLGKITSLHETGGIYGYRTGTTTDAAFRTCREKLVSWLAFITSNHRLANKPSAEFGNDCVEIAYDSLFDPEYRRDETERRLPFAKFQRLFEQRPLDLPEDYSGEEYDLTIKDISNLVYPMRTQRQLCAIQLVPSIGKTNQGPLDLAIKEETTIGLCSRSAKVEDVVAVVVGCRNPLVLRRDHERFEVIGNIYVHGFMDGQAMNRFEEVVIELV